MFSCDFNKRIRYSETDKMGYLYYGNYAALYEIGRVESMRALGIMYKSMEDDLGIMMPVLSLESRYHAPAYYDEVVTIRTTLKEMPSKMITFHHDILNEKEDVINRGIVKLFFVDIASNKRISIPEFIKEKLKPHFD